MRNERLIICMVLVGVAVLICVVSWGGGILLFDKYIKENRAKDVVVAQIVIDVDTNRIEEGFVRGVDKFCERLRSILVDHGVGHRFIRVHSVEKVGNDDVVEGVILVSVRRQQKFGDIDVENAIQQVVVPGIEVVSLKSSVRTYKEWLDWKQVAF